MESASIAGAKDAFETLLSPARTTADVGSSRTGSPSADMQPQDLAPWLRKDHRQVEQLADRLRERVAIIPRIGPETHVVVLKVAMRDLRS